MPPGIKRPDRPHSHQNYRKKEKDPYQAKKHNLYRATALYTHTSQAKLSAAPKKASTKTIKSQRARPTTVEVKEKERARPKFKVQDLALLSL